MLAGVIGRARTVRQEDGAGRRTRRLRWPVLIAAGAIALFCCARLLDRQIGAQSDGASQVLEAWAMWHGNPLLRGWYLSDVSFYTTELPEYILVELFRGIRPDVVNISSALTYTLIVLLAAAVAYGSAARAGKRAGLAGAVITVAVLLGPLPIATRVVLNDPDHVGSVVPVLLAFLLASRTLDGRPRSGVRYLALAAAVTAVLAVAMVGDPLIVIFGIAPLVLVCGGSALWRLAVRRQLAGLAPELSLAVAGLAAAAAGTWLTGLIQASGGYAVTPLKHRQVLPSGMLTQNAGGVVRDVLILFSADFSHVESNAWLAVTAVHLVFACLVALALVLVSLRFFRGDDLIARLLATGIVANLAAYALFYQAMPVTTREIGPVFGLGGALAGRVLGGRAVRLRLERLVAAAAVAALAALVPPLLTVVPGPPTAGTVAAFLASHNMRSGLGGYWQANAITVETGGRVTVLSVHTQAGTILAPFKWELDTGKLRVPGHQADFVVVTPPGQPGAPGAGGGVTEREAIKMFGTPARVYQLPPGYTILAWRKNLLPALTAPIPHPARGPASGAPG